MQTKQILGQHALLDLHGCDVSVLGNVENLQALLLRAAESAQATVLFHHFHHFGGESGVTGVLLLAESHISIHTWTEHAFAAADVFLCGERVNLQAACQVLVQGLNAQQFDFKIQNRGLL